jgi:hypothetical protein
MGFEALIPTWQRPQTHVLDHAATGLDTTAQKRTKIELKIFILYYYLNMRKLSCFHNLKRYFTKFYTVTEP